VISVIRYQANRRGIKEVGDWTAKVRRDDIGDGTAACWKNGKQLVAHGDNTKDAQVAERTKEIGSVVAVE
jgi:hypothetical protein